MKFTERFSGRLLDAGSPFALLAFGLPIIIIAAAIAGLTIPAVWLIRRSRRNGSHRADAKGRGVSNGP